MRVRAIAAVLLGSVLLLTGCSGPGNPEGQNASDLGFIEGAGTVITKAPAERGDAPKLEGDKLGGGTLSIDDYRGRIVVVNVWGAWCTPCRKEMPGLIASSKELGKLDVDFVGINTGGDNTASATAYVRAAGVPFPSFFDPQGKLLLNLRDSIPPKAIPSTLVLAPDGRVAAAVIGGVTQQALSKVVGQVIRENARASASASTSPAATP